METLPNFNTSKITEIKEVVIKEELALGEIICQGKICHSWWIMYKDVKLFNLVLWLGEKKQIQNPVDTQQEMHLTFYEGVGLFVQQGLQWPLTHDRFSATQISLASLPIPLFSVHILQNLSTLN